jgi:hypothetical protein
MELLMLNGTIITRTRQYMTKTIFHRVISASTLGLFVATLLLGIMPPVFAAACGAPPADYGVDTMTVNAPSNGTYILWTRLMVPDTTNNSINAEVDGSSCFNVGGSSAIPANTWTWVNYQNGVTGTANSVTLTAGNHTVKLVGTKPGVLVDRVFITTDTTCTPSGATASCTAPADTTPPTVTITAPTNGSTVSGTVSVAATATDPGTSPSGVKQVDFYVDGNSTPVTTDTASPYAYSWNTTSPLLANGTHTIAAKATDNAGNVSTVASNSVTVSNADTTAPTNPTLATPTATSSSVSLSWSGATDNVGVTNYLVYRAQNGTGTGASQIASLGNVTTYTDSTVASSTIYTYYVVAKDAAGNLSPNATTPTGTTKTITTLAAADTTAPSNPGSPTATVVNSALVNLSWTASTDTGGSNLAGYNVYRNGTLITTVIQPATTFGDGTVAASTTYTYTIEAIDGAGNKSAKVATSPTSVTTPAPPDTTAPTISAVASSLITTTGATITWTTNEAATTQVDYGTTTSYGSSSTLNSSLVTSHSVALTGLNPSTTYHFRVKSADAASNLATGTDNTFTTTTPPDTTAPTVAITAPTNGSTISGTTTVTATATDPGTSPSLVKQVDFYVDGSSIPVATDTTSPYSFPWNTTSPLLANGTHTIAAKATDNAGNASAVASNSVTVNNGDLTAPTAPTSLATSNVTYNSVTLNWSGATDNVLVTHYQVFRYLTSANPNTAMQVADVTGTTFTDNAANDAANTPQPNTGYTYYVVALDAAGNFSPHSPTATATTLVAPDTTPPTDPGTPTVTAANSFQVNLSWAKSTDAVSLAGYNVYRAVVTNGVVGTYTKLPPPTGNTSYTVTAPGSTTPVTFSDGTVNPSTTYSYQIEAVDSAGNVSVHRIPQNNSAQVTTPALGDTTPPSQPINVRSFTTQTGPTLTPTANTITVTWDPSTDNTGVATYKLYRKTPTDTSFQLIATLTAPTVTFTDYATSGYPTSVSYTPLLRNTTYTYQVIAYDAANNPSAASPATALQTAGLIGDLNGDGHVTVQDGTAILGKFGQHYPRGEFFGVPQVGVRDVTALLGNFGK